MFKAKIFSTIALGTVLVTGAFMTAGVANAAPACPSGVVCQNDGKMHRPHGTGGSGMQNSGDSVQHSSDNRSMDWRRRHHNYSNNNPSFGIYVNTGDGYGYRHHRRCKMVKIWRHHHPVWVKKCYWPHRY